MLYGYSQSAGNAELSYVRTDFLEEVILSEIHRLARFACKYEEEFVKTVSALSKQSMDAQISAYQSKIRSLTARDKDLDRIFERLYEDNLSGTDELISRFNSEAIRLMSSKQVISLLYTFIRFISLAVTSILPLVSGR